MKDSTRRVRETAMNISHNYFDNKKRWASIQNGEDAFMNRANQFMQMASDLHYIAETPRAHECADNLTSVILKDVCEARRKWFKG